MDRERIKSDVAASLAEDIGSGDITAKLIMDSQHIVAQIICREPAVLCGSAWAEQAFMSLDDSIRVEWLKRDGDELEANHVFLRVSGPARPILTAERCALNWLQTLSSTATLTASYCRLLAGTDCKILDTRKTIPGLRYAQKYAVRCGGGTNHRLGLYDMFLIKENHITSCGSLSGAVEMARQLNSEILVEVEVENLQQLELALHARADVVMLDNFSLHDLSSAVLLNQGQAKLEASGNVTLETVKDIASTGVDFISCGALTKHVQAVDLSMRVVELIT